VQTQFFALQGMGKLMDVVKLVKRRLNPNLDLSGIILTMYDKRTNLAHEVVEEVRKYFKEKVFATLIRANIRIAEAPGHGKTILEYDSQSAGAKDYMTLAREVAGVEPETEPMVWPPPGFEEEARRAEAKLRELISKERKKEQNSVEGLAEVGLESIDAKEMEQENAEPVLREQPEPAAGMGMKSQLSSTEMDEEIREIKEMIELAAGEGFMKFAGDDTQASGFPPPAIPDEQPGSHLPSPVYEDITAQDKSDETGQLPLDSEEESKTGEAG